MTGSSRFNSEDAAQGSYLPRAPATELKGSVFTLTVLRLLSTNLDAVEKELKDHLAQAPRFFLNAPLVIDINAVKERSDLDFQILGDVLRQLNLIPVGVRNGTVALNARAVEAGFAVMRGGVGQDLPVKPGPAKQEPSPGSRPEAPVAAVEKPVAVEPPPAPEPATAPPVTDAPSATVPVAKSKIIDQPIRSGQQVYAPDGDLIVLAAVNAGAEIIADGNIHVYAPMRGRALAGVKGDNNARIFCHSMEAELVAIAGHYQVFEDKVPQPVYQRPVHVHLDDGRLIISPLN
jgi:septum site-determining protein MinC